MWMCSSSGNAPPWQVRVEPQVEQKPRRIPGEEAKRVKAGLSISTFTSSKAAKAAAEALAEVERIARDGGNLMPPIVAAVRAYCTLGEISDAMRRVFGEYKPAALL